ncbi:MAG: hypothetical protein NVS1B14_08170 [Vulcanimicrobiaceae bacterium]
MQFRLGRAFNAALLTLGTLLALAACSSRQYNTGLVVPSPSPTPQSSTTFTVAAAGSTQALPAGYNIPGNATFPNATSGSGSAFTIAETGNAPPTGLPNLNPPNVLLLYFSFSDPTSVTFTGFPGFSFTLPAGVNTSTQQFFIAFYDPKNPAAGWQTGFSGPASVSGQTLTFTGSSTPFAMTGGSTYNFALYAIPTGPTPPPPANPKNIYVSNSGAGATRNSIVIFPARASGNVIPTGTIAGAATGLNLPNGLNFGNNNVLYVANGGGSITEYPAGTTGNTAPSATITSPGLVSPQMIALDSANNILVTQNSANGAADSVTLFGGAASGVTTPALVIAGPATGLSIPIGIALDTHNTVYVANSGNNSVTEYSESGGSNQAPGATIAGPLTTLSNPTGIGLDSSNNIYVANSNGSITIYKAGSHGNVAPAATISGSGTLLNVPMELFLDANGLIYVANNGAGGPGSNSVLTFLGAASGNALPTQDITGPSTGLNSPFGVAAR